MRSEETLRVHRRHLWVLSNVNEEVVSGLSAMNAAHLVGILPICSASPEELDIWDKQKSAPEQKTTLGE